MRLTRVFIQNFRGVKELLEVHIEPSVTAFVGRNDAGKSTILDAIAIFMSEESPEIDDACVSGDRGDVRIGAEFSDIPDSLVLDAQSLTTLGDECLLTSRGTLHVEKRWDCSGAKTGRARVFFVCDHPTEPRASDLLSLKLADLKKRALDVGVDLNSVDQTAKPSLRQAIRARIGDLRLSRTELEVRSSDDVAGVWDRVRPLMPVFSIFKSDRPSTDQDAEAQDPMMAAVKEAIADQEHRLQEVKAHVETAIRDIADATVARIRELDASLASELVPRVTTKKWDSLFSVSLTGDSAIPVNKRGSGVRRLILLSFFRARAEKQSADAGRSVIYAIEEPETSQHPSNQAMILEALEDLAEQAGVQVLITTHTPVLARRLNGAALRFVQRTPNVDERVRSGTEDGVLGEIAKSLGVLRDHNVRLFLGVEGRHDIAFLRGIAERLRAQGEVDIPDIAAAEDSGQLVFIPLGGSNVELWVGRLDGLEVQQAHLMDRDNPPDQPPKYHRIAQELEARGCIVWTTSKRELENYLHLDAIRALEGLDQYAGTGDPHEDVPNLAARAIHSAAGTGTWESLDTEKRKSKVSRAKHRLNREAVALMTAERLTEVDTADEVRTWLRRIGEMLAG